MDSLASIQGLATGIDFRDLVDQMIKAESRPVLVMEDRKSALGREGSAWGEFEQRIRALDDVAAALGRGTVFGARTTTVGGEGAAFTAVAGPGSSTGTYTVDVLQLPARESVGSDVFQGRTTPLGVSGEFLLGGRAVAVSAEDTLQDVVASINAVNTSPGRSGVIASIVGSDAVGHRVVLTANETGAAGIRMSDGPADILRTLGFLDGTTSIRHPTSDGATSAAFSSPTSSVAAQLGMGSPPRAATVGIGALSVTLDLAHGLAAAATAINEAAASAGSAIRAEVAQEQGIDGRVSHRLDVSGTTSFADAEAILETLGILEGNRGPVAQELRATAFTGADGVSPATGATLLVDLSRNGQSVGVRAGDTLSWTGTRGDGTTFSRTFEIDAGSTMQDLVNALDGPEDGYGAGERTATVSLVDGALAVSDDQGGNSRLALSIVSHNEGGGALDFGSIAVTTVGRNREITAGRDAELQVDGAFYSRSSYAVNDIIPGVTLSLAAVSTEPTILGVEPDLEAVAREIERFVEAFNSASEFVSRQFTGVGATDEGVRPPLSGKSILRSMRTRLKNAFDEALATTTGTLGTLSEIGITMTRSGTYEVDGTRLRGVIENDPFAVERLFSMSGETTGSGLKYVSAGDATEPGTYEVVVTTPPTRPIAIGAGFGGTYVDDAAPDVLTIMDSSSGAAYEISLLDGMTLQDIVEALNLELGTPPRRRLESTASLSSDALGTAAGPATALADLHSESGVGAGVSPGDTLTIAGVRPDGTSFFREWTISDPAQATLGDLRAQISSAIGPEVAVDVVDGAITAVALEEGAGAFTLTLSSDNAGGGTLDFGGFAVDVAGRAAARLTASAVGGQLAIEHQDYGSAAGFSLAFTAGGADGTGALGLGAGTFAGTDVTGTIGGRPASGVGRILTGDDGTGVAGLAVMYAGTVGSVGSVTLSRGLAAEVDRVTSALLSGEAGSIQGIVEGLDTQKRSLDDRIDAFESRLEMRAQNLIRRFTALEEAMAKAQQQLAWLQTQLGSLVAPR